MGEVKDAVHGTGRKTPAVKEEGAAASDGLVARIDALRDEISRLTVIKDGDVNTEGPEARAENIRKAALLRAGHSLATSIKALLEDY